ncbi:tetraacyldisaccharide 4'-kinase [Adhaeribacter sp. BT258]|uniref:Tetraacyldisaccharide 4'-kinase n=2 Tax=Adhaeribacter terrigena TaxID=2793070 RepID=A0ABS1C0Q1_9BACT|nr:tetraacyldisaccharide 4'-kinase [Adhaeribacter terrigena]
MKFLKWLLFPFALLYGGIMLLRNFLYDQGIFKSEQFDLPVISVGNLTVGGTGKTPHVEFLLRLLKDYKTATLSRGYKRSTTGFVLANPSVSAATIGDEPFQYYLDFPETTVAVCEKRAEGIQQIQERKPETEVIILDDAFQHRAVMPNLNLLITDFYRRFDTDFMLPTGLLREPRWGAKRADAVIVSKCPENLLASEKQQLENGIKKYTKTATPVFFTSYHYGETVGFGAEKVCSKNVILVTGIANPQPLITYLLEAGYAIQEHLNWPDHHHYTQPDVEKMQQVSERFRPENVSILTTRKDAVKLMQPAFAGTVKQLPFFYVPIEVKFLEKQAAFEQMVLATVKA